MRYVYRRYRGDLRTDKSAGQCPGPVAPLCAAISAVNWTVLASEYLADWRSNRIVIVRG